MLNINNDKAIEFQTIRYKIEKNLKRLKEIDLNITKYENLFNAIINKCNEGTKIDVDNVFGAAESFSFERLKNTYIKGITDLERILGELEKYEVYFQIASFNNYLKLFISSANKDRKDFDNFREQILFFLDKLKKSDTLDYEVEGDIVENTYNLVYQFIKEEIKNLSESPTLRILKEDEIHKFNLDKQIANELENIDLENDNYSLIKEITNKMNMKNGLNSTYLDEELIFVLIMQTMSEKDMNKQIKQIKISVKTFNNKIQEIIEEKIGSQERIRTYKNEKESLLKSIYRNTAIFLSSTAIVSSLVAGSFFFGIKGAKWAATETKYKKTTYNSLDENIAVEEGYAKTENSTKVYKYEPYVEKNNQYTRSITTYDVSKLEELDLEEYLNINLNILGINGIEKTEWEPNMSLSDLYKETYYIVEKIVTDEEDKKIYKIGFIAIDIILNIIFLYISGVIYMMIDDSFYYKNNKNEKKERKVAFIESLKDLMEEFYELNENKKDIKEIEQKVQELSLKTKKLVLENKEKFEQIEKNIKKYENSITMKEEFREIKKDVSQVLELIRKN